MLNLHIDFFIPEKVDLDTIELIKYVEICNSFWTLSQFLKSKSSHEPNKNFCKIIRTSIRNLMECVFYSEN